MNVLLKEIPCVEIVAPTGMRFQNWWVPMQFWKHLQEKFSVVEKNQKNTIYKLFFFGGGV